jgi:WD40 repeat protein
MKRTNGLRTRVIIISLFLAVAGTIALAQSPTPTPDQRGLGVKSSTSKTDSQSQGAREAKPELVLQTGYNNLFGATRFLFSPDGRLLATTTMRSGTVKLWETATGRELRNLSGGPQSGMSLSPFIAFSRDSRMLATAAGDNTVKIFDVITGREIQTLSSSQGTMASAMSGVYFIAFTADGRVVTISDAIRVWNVASGQAQQTNTAGALNPTLMMGGGAAAVLTPDDSQLVYVSTDEGSAVVKFLELNSGREVKANKFSDKDVDSLELAYTPDGRLLVAGIVDQRLRVWDLSGKGTQRELGPTATDYESVRFSRDGRLVALAQKYTVKVWDAATGREIQTLKAPNSGMFTEQGRVFTGFSDDGRKIATGGFDTPTILWETETAKQLLTMSGRTNMAYKVAFSADGTKLWSGGRTRWDLREGRGSRITPGPSDNTMALPSPDGKYLASFTGNSEVLTISELPNGNILHRLSPGSTGSVVQRAMFSRDGTMVMTSYAADYTRQQQPTALMPGGLETQLKIWDVKTGRELRTIQLGANSSEAGFNGDGRLLATLGMMGEISLWDASTGARVRELKSSPIASITKMMDPAAMRGGIKPGQMPNIADISAMMTSMMGAMSAGTMGRTVTSFAFSPDGNILATGGVESKSNFDMAAMMSGSMPGQKGQKRNSKNPPDPDEIMRNMKVEAVGQVVLWDVNAGQEIGALKGHGKGVTAVAFSRDGKLIASGSTDNTIRIWDLNSKREVRTLSGHTSNIESIDFSPDGRLLASAADDGATFLWDVNTGEQLLTLISLDDGGEWMAVTPQGLFDGTPVSWNQILWRYNQDTFNVAPIEWFFTEFYYPGLLSDILAGKRPRVADDVSRKDRRQPMVKLSLIGDQPPATGVASRNVKVKIEVSDAPSDSEHKEGAGARDLRLFRNGSLVKVWHGDVLKGQPAVTLEEDITITAGANRLTAYAFNRDNVKSKDAPLLLTGADTLKRFGTAFVIAVGVNEYANPQYNLKYAVADAQSFGEEVKAKQTQIAHFERVEVVPLLNQEATKANILAALRRLAGEPGPPSLKAGPIDKLKRAEPEDTVIIYFAGHGTAQAQRFYLIPHDLGYEGDRTKLTEDGLRSILAHSISDAELEQAVEGLDAGHLLLVIDACNSGQALEAEEKRRGPMNSKGLAQLAYEKGMYILTAAQSYQAALEAAQLGHGLLTYALVEEGLKTAVADNGPKDGTLSAREWLNFATERVPQMQEEKMRSTRGVGIAFAEGEQNIADPEKRSVQRPRVFYRRELEGSPLVIAKPQ